jgi:hypothetical protein
MTAPFRIIHPEAGEKQVSANQAPAREYFERLIKMIPAEVVGLYLVGSGFIPESQRIVLLIWTLVCLFGVVAIRIWGTADPSQNNPRPPQWPAVFISTVSFALWIYSIGGAFAAYGLSQPYLASLLVLGWTFFVPIFYKGSFE